jgi:hypothetical protein
MPNTLTTSIEQMLSETALTPNEARRHRALRNPRTGKALDVSGFYRLVKRGALGTDGERVRLEAYRCPSGLITTAEAITRFVQRLNGLTTTPTATKRVTREKQLGSAVKELQTAGLM